MDKLEKIENKILNSPVYDEILLNFEINKWKKSSTKNRLANLLLLDELFHESLTSEVDIKNVQSQKLNSHFLKMIDKSTYRVFDIMREYFVYTRIKMQQFAIMTNNKDKLISDYDFEKIKSNFRKSLTGEIKTNFSEYHELYSHQPYMLEAVKYADEFLNKTFAKIGLNHLLSEQASNHLIRERIQHEIKTSPEKEQKALEIIREKNNLIDKEFHEIYEFVGKVANKKVSELTNEELDCYISPAFNNIVNHGKKMELIDEYSSRKLKEVGINKKADLSKVLKETDSAIFNAIYILTNTIFENINDYKGDSKIIEEIKINTHKEGNKSVNIIKDANTLDYYLQPIVMFTNEKFIKYRNEINQSLKKNFSVKTILNSLSKMNVIDKEALSETIKSFYNVDFDHYRNEMINKMEQRILNKNENIKRGSK